MRGHHLCGGDPEARRRVVGGSITTCARAARTGAAAPFLLQDPMFRNGFITGACALQVLAVAAGLAAPSADAAVIRQVGNRVEYEAAAREINAARVEVVAGVIVVTDPGVTLVDGDGSTGCAVLAGRATCPSSGVNRVVVTLGDGDDTVVVASGLASRVDGGPGNDGLTGGSAADTLLGGDGVDVLDGGGGGDSLVGGVGADRFIGGTGRDRVSYSERVAPVQVSLDGVAGDGESGEGDDVGPDVEDLVGGAANDALVGSPTGNQIVGGAGDDTISGGDGSDDLRGEEGADTLDGGAGSDRLAGGFGKDRLRGGDGRDVLLGGGDGDQLFGGPSRDTLSGGDGDDRLASRDGTPDRVFCGRGRDVAVVDGGGRPDKVAAGCEGLRRT